MSDDGTAHPAVHHTDIPGLLIIDLKLHSDARGWFKENWQRAKMTAAGLPDFGPVQHNVAVNGAVGVTRGVHAEPWDKLISLVSGKIFGAWVDLRAGDSFGTVVTRVIDPQTAVFVPSGVGNAYQTLEPMTAYSYLVNRHWSAEASASYTFVNLADESLAISWPIPLQQAELSEADRRHPRLGEVTAVRQPRTVVLGGGGQVGRALANAWPDALVYTRDHIDLTVPEDLDTIPWSEVGAVVNAAAFTGVDAAETPPGRSQAWEVNVTALAHLVSACRENRVPLVQLSSDYVFDGSASEHTEADPVSPLGVYGQTKAAGDALVATWAQHYIVRSSWVIGDGKNFVRTMVRLAEEGACPEVVSDQMGRLTFATDLAAGIDHLLTTRAPFGIYNLTCSGPVQSWADIAREVFRLCGRNPHDITAVSTSQYSTGKSLSPRPACSTLSLSKIQAGGFTPGEGPDLLKRYLAVQTS